MLGRVLDDREFMNVCAGTLEINFLLVKPFFFLFDDLPEFVLSMSFFHPIPITYICFLRTSKRIKLESPTTSHIKDILKIFPMVIYLLIS